MRRLAGASLSRQEPRILDFDEQVLAQMMTTFDRFTDDEMPASAEVVPEVRLFFARWAEELSPACPTRRPSPVVRGEQVTYPGDAVRQLRTLPGCPDHVLFICMLALAAARRRPRALATVQSRC